MLRRLAISILLISVLALSQMSVNTATDLACDGANHQLSTTSQLARWIQLVAPSTNAAVVRWGDVNISGSRGAEIAAGGGQYFPPASTVVGGSATSTYYDPSRIYYRCTSPDVLTITWGF